MITLNDYFSKWWLSDEVTSFYRDDATELLKRVNALLDEAFEHGVDLLINPKTGSYVSGTHYGGFRPQDCPEGAPNSSHKQGQGVDVYDPLNALDNWVTDKILEKHDLYRESPLATKGWCHLTTRPPKSGKRTFLP